jgi:hypothetical protein
LYSCFQTFFAAFLKIETIPKQKKAIASSMKAKKVKSIGEI